MQTSSGRNSLMGLANFLPRVSTEDNNQLEHNFEEFIYRDTITRKHYVFGTLKEKKIKLTIARLKNPAADKAVIKDVGGHLQILSNIKEYRFNELLSESKSLKRLKEELITAELSKYWDCKKDMMQIKSNMFQSLNSYNMDCFRKYLSSNVFDKRLNVMKKIENNKITEQELEELLQACSKENQVGTPETLEKRKVVSEELLKDIEQEFEGKYRKQFQALEGDIKNKINNQVRYLVQPQNDDCKVSIKKTSKPSILPKTSFQSHLDEIHNKTLDIGGSLKSAKHTKVLPSQEDSNSNFEYLKHLIVNDHSFDVQCQLTEHPEYIHLLDDKGNSLLHHAAKEGRYTICRLLLSKNIERGHKNNLGYTALKVASHFNQREIMQLISSQPQNPITSYQ